MATAVMGNRDVMSSRDASLLNLMYCDFDPNANASEPVAPFVPPPASPGNGYAQNLLQCFLNDVVITEVLEEEKEQAADILPGAGGAFAASTNRTKLIYILVAVGLFIVLVCITFFFSTSLRSYVEGGQVDEFRSETERPLIVE